MTTNKTTDFGYKENSAQEKSEESTYFGYKKIPWQDKAAKVAEVFHSVAGKYDVMNDVMSLGVHRLWKRTAVALSGVKPGHHILDLAGGTGDLAIKFAAKTGETGQVVLSDINESMLKIGCDRMLDHGVFGNIDFVLADAESLPFPDNCFDCVSMAFGLRNVTHKETALAEIIRTLKPGGRVIILEFSKPVLKSLEKLYDLYSFQVIPKLGQWITGDAESYQYLIESIRKHPDQETLKAMMQACGYSKVEYFNLTAGVVAIHRGFKL